MLIIALVLAVIGLAALVFAVVTSNALVAWVCIGASALGVLLLIVDALAERRRKAEPVAGAASGEEPEGEPAAETADEPAGESADEAGAEEPDTDEPADEAAGGEAEDTD